mgnify:CR=1 FL=1
MIEWLPQIHANGVIHTLLPAMFTKYSIRGVQFPLGKWHGAFAVARL